jgi:hypothetical protein
MEPNRQSNLPSVFMCCGSGKFYFLWLVFTASSLFLWHAILFPGTYWAALEVLVSITEFCRDKMTTHLSHHCFINLYGQLGWFVSYDELASVSIRRLFKNRRVSLIVIYNYSETYIKQNMGNNRNLFLVEIC